MLRRVQGHLVDEEEHDPIRVDPPHDGGQIARTIIGRLEMQLRERAHLQRLLQSDLGPTSADVDGLDVENLLVRSHDHGPRHTHPGVSAQVRPLANHLATTRNDARIGRTAQSFVIASPSLRGLGLRALSE